MIPARVTEYRNVFNGMTVFTKKTVTSIVTEYRNVFNDVTDVTFVTPKDTPVGKILGEREIFGEGDISLWGYIYLLQLLQLTLLVLYVIDIYIKKGVTVACNVGVTQQITGLAHRWTRRFSG
jgi:hypothetical protein